MLRQTRIQSTQEVIQGRVHSNTYRINPNDERGEEWIVVNVVTIPTTEESVRVNYVKTHRGKRM